MFHEEEERGGGKGETTVAQDDEDEEGEGDEEEGVEADYEGVLHADVSRVAELISAQLMVTSLGDFQDCGMQFSASGLLIAWPHN